MHLLSRISESQRGQLLAMTASSLSFCVKPRLSSRHLRDHHAPNHGVRKLGAIPQWAYIRFVPAHFS